MCVHVDTICYDDGCHLLKYARRPERSSASTTATKLSIMNIVIDKMHFKGHVDNWCHKNCNPYSLSQLDNVSTTNLQK